MTFVDLHARNVLADANVSDNHKKLAAFSLQWAHEGGTRMSPIAVELIGLSILSA